MGDLVIGIIYLMVTISLLVIAHEGGHYLAARVFRMRVEDFSLFFGPVLFRLGKRGDTVFNVRSVPFGGFVKIAGMEPEDVSAGVPVLRALYTASRPGSERLYDEAIRRLSKDTLAGVDAAHVGTSVRQSVAEAITDTYELTPEGRVILSALRTADGATPDEVKFLDVVLNAHSRATDSELFSSKPRIQRAAVILAGPLASLLFGYLVFCAMGLTAGLPTSDGATTNQIAEVVPGGEAHRVRLRVGDRITAINGVPVRSGKQLVDTIHHSLGIRLTITVARSGRTFTADVTPRRRMFTDESGKRVAWGILGITPNVELKRVGAWESVRVGSVTTYVFVGRLLQILSDREQAKESIGGPIAIGHMATMVQRLGLGPMMLLAAQFSLSLCILNLLPIPVLDGGHLLLISLESLRRRRLSPREVYGAHALGLGIIAVLVLFVTYNDIMRLLVH